MTFSIHMANIVFHDKPVESNGEAEKIRNDPTLSPHSRGTRLFEGNSVLLFGIIPAFAGNTLFANSRSRSSRDHPRIRGEHFASDFPAAAAEGSSPHSRGNTLTVWLCLPVDEDHPRIRGEHPHQMDGLKGRRGSSPHSRGTHRILWGLSGPPGIIPAFAGNTHPHGFCLCHLKDHPRIRGEHYDQLIYLVNYLGSSPHSRGTLWLCHISYWLNGIIPAFAGNTSRL